MAKKVLKQKSGRPVAACPRCGKWFEDYPALSRRDNKTQICPNCGTDEAMEDHFKIKYDGPVYWQQAGQHEHE